MTFDQNPHIIRPGENLVLAVSGTITHTDPMQELERFFDAGGLMSYGATQSEIYGIAAEQVAKILDGARPSEWPLRQATRFELVINNRTAKALGLTIPPSLLQRADQVIE